MENSINKPSRTARASRIQHPIAIRRYQNLSSPGRTILVTIGAPQPHAEGDWACPLDIQGIPGRRPPHVFGVDAIQALQMAIEAARFHLESSGIRFQWLDDEDSCRTGISRLIPHTFGASFERKIVKAIEREVERELGKREAASKAAERRDSAEATQHPSRRRPR